MPETVELNDIIHNIAQKKQAVTAKARAAKQAVDAEDNAQSDVVYQIPTEQVDSTRPDPSYTKSDQAISAFNESIRVLSHLIKHTHLDDCMVLLSHPARLFGISVLNGICRGIGFSIGVIGILAILMYAFRGTHLYELFNTLLSNV
jgi:hypothetical protein